MKKLLIILCLFLFASCTQVMNGHFISTEKPIIILDKKVISTRYGNYYYFRFYVGKTVDVEVDKGTWNSRQIGDTIRNVAIVID